MPQAGVFSVTRLTAVASLLFSVPQAAFFVPQDILTSPIAPRGNVPQASPIHGSSTGLLEHPSLTSVPQAEASAHHLPRCLVPHARANLSPTRRRL